MTDDIGKWQHQRIKTSDKSLVFFDEQHSATLIKGLQQQYERRENLNLQLRISNTTVDVHKVVACAMSDTIRAAVAFEQQEDKKGLLELSGEHVD